MAQRVIGALLLAILAGLLAWSAGQYVARGMAYRRDIATVRQADAVLADGRPVVALQLLAGAGQAGQERLGRLVVASHTPREWPRLLSAAQAAGQDVREALASVLGRSPEESLCAAEALAALGDSRGVRTLGWALAQPPAEAHDPTELTCLGPPSVEALLNTARYGPAEGAKRAVALLGSFDAPGARRALLGLVRDHRFPYRIEALRATCRHGESALQGQLPELLADPDPVFRAEAAYQYGAVVGAPALPVLQEALRDCDPAVRAAAVEAASLIDGPEANALLIRALRDPEPRIVRKAVWSLGCRRCGAAETALVRLYHKASPDLQRDVLRALFWIGSPLGPEYARRWQRETGRPFALASE